MNFSLVSHNLTSSLCKLGPGLTPGRQLYRQATRNLVRLLCRLRRYDEATSLCELFLDRFGHGDVDVCVDYVMCQHHARNHAGPEEALERPELLARYRNRLAQYRATHPLFDMARFTADLEHALLEAWQRETRARS